MKNIDIGYVCFVLTRKQLINEVDIQNVILFSNDCFMEFDKSLELDYSGLSITYTIKNVPDCLVKTANVENRVCINLDEILHINSLIDDINSTNLLECSFQYDFEPFHVDVNELKEYLEISLSNITFFEHYLYLDYKQ